MLRLQPILAITLMEFARGHVKSKGKVLLQLVASLLNCPCQQLDRLHITAAHMWRVATLIANSRRVALGLEYLRQRVKHLGAHPHRVLERRCADWDDHVFLNISSTERVLPAVHHIDHRHRQAHRASIRQLIDIDKKLNTLRLSRRLGNC